MKYQFKKFMADERGLETVEYAVLTALIVGSVIGVVTAVGLLVRGWFGTVETALTPA
jgi:Flp pilus assembly pilin Flp